MSNITSPPPHAGTRPVKLGIISGAHGIRGQVKIRSLTEDPADITAYGPLNDASGRQYTLKITGTTKDTLIASVEGVATREEAEKLRNTELFVARSALPKTQQNQYYHEDLAGLKVITENGEAYGVVAGVHNFGAGDLLYIKRIDGEEDFLPFTRNTFPLIEPEKGRITIAPPDVAADD